MIKSVHVIQASIYSKEFNQEHEDIYIFLNTSCHPGALRSYLTHYSIMAV